MFRRAVQCKRNITSRVIHNSNRTPKKSRYSNGSIYLKSSPFQSFCLILLPLRGAPCNHKRMIVPLGLVISWVAGGKRRFAFGFLSCFLIIIRKLERSISGDTFTVLRVKGQVKCVQQLNEKKAIGYKKRK